jgi:6-pyruvoyltetrahydropterin/6-carboxytetrahydropterin synthase
MYELRIVNHFAAAHQLRMVARKCENLHGHNWKVEVCVRGPKLSEAGVLVDFGVLKAHLAEIMATLDHRFLNDLEMFSDAFPPSSENIAAFIAGRLEEKLADSPARVHSVTTWESENACATYRVSNGDRP